MRRFLESTLNRSRLRLTDGAIDPEDWFWLVGSVLQLLERDFDPAKAVRSSPPPYTAKTLPQSCEPFGLKMCPITFLDGLGGVPFPAIAFSKSDDSTSPREAPREEMITSWEIDNASRRDIRKSGPISMQPVLLVQGDSDRVLYYRARCTTPEVAPENEVLQSIHPVGWLVQFQASDVETRSDFASQPERFGYRWFIPHLLRHRSIWLEVLSVSLLIQLAGLAMPLLTQIVLDKVVAYRASSTLLTVSAGLILFAAFNVLMSWSRQYLVVHTGTRIDAALEATAFGRLVRLPVAWFEQRSTGTINARLRGVETVREFLCGAAIAFALDIPFALVFLVVMISYSWELSLVAVSGVALITAVSLVIAPILRRRVDLQYLASARSQAIVTEYVSGISSIKVLQAEARVASRFDETLAASLKAAFETRQLANTYGAAISSLEQITTIGVLVVGASLTMEKPGFTIGMLVAFQMFLSRLSQPVMRLANLWQEAQQAAVAIHRLRDLMDCPMEGNTIEIRRQRSRAVCLEIENLGFRYGQDRPWLFRGLGFSLKKGDLIVVTGPSGCGKSTLVGLLLGFRRCEEGGVMLDGVDSRNLASNELRDYFGVVPQDPVLFSGTVLDNLLLAAPAARFEDVVEACRGAEIHREIEALSNGYLTHIGERGTGLSGGQKQRLAIAQALLKRASVLIFDEATSALDEAVSMKLVHTISGLRHHVGIIFIAHRVPPGLEVSRTIHLGA